MPNFNSPIPGRESSERVFEAREKPERGTPVGLIRKPLQEPPMEPVKEAPLNAEDRP